MRKASTAFMASALCTSIYYRERNILWLTIMNPVYENSHLSGAVFEIHAAEDIVGKEDTVFCPDQGKAELAPANKKK